MSTIHKVKFGINIRQNINMQREHENTGHATEIE